MLTFDRKDLKDSVDPNDVVDAIERAIQNATERYGTRRRAAVVEACIHILSSSLTRDIPIEEWDPNI